MSTTKKISGDYNIISIDPSAGDNVNITTHTINITGNLDVTGNVTYINVNDLTVDDPFITVAGNNAGNTSTAPFQQQGLVAQTSANTFAGIRFNNPTNTWQSSPSVNTDGSPITGYANIVTGNSTNPGGANTFVQYNENGSFGGSSLFTYDYALGKLTISGYQAFANIGGTPPAVAGQVELYHNEIGSGGTGLYVNSAAATGELVSKKKAIVFALIF